MENLPEPAHPTSNSSTRRFVIINGLLLGVVALLLLAASQEEGYLGGLGEIMVIFGLMLLGALVNLSQAINTKGSRVGFLLMATLYGAVFAYFCYEIAHMGKLNPGGR
jgi:hypothetical protein